MAHLHEPDETRLAAGLLIPFLLASVFLSAGCNRSGELGKASTFTKPSGPVELKLHWRVGERIVKNCDMKLTSEITVPNQPNPIHQDMTCRQQWAVTVRKANADGSHEGEMELRLLQPKLDQDGKPLVDYDSARKSSPAGADPRPPRFRKPWRRRWGPEFNLG